MTDKEANMKRLIANEIMSQFWKDGHIDQLHILKSYAERAIENLRSENSVELSSENP